MKTCSACRFEFPVSFFFNRKDTKDGLSYYCKNCSKHAVKKHSSAGLNESTLLFYRDSAKDFIRKLKEVPCTDCRKIYEHYCMEFDHLFDKKYRVSGMIGFSIERILEETSKCEVVCVLCHRDRTHTRNSKLSHDDRVTLLNRNIILSIKNGSCVMCGYKYDHWKMDLDHIDPNSKKKNLSRYMASRRNYVKQIESELEKCQLLCALCHRRKTFSGLQNVI